MLGDLERFMRPVMTRMMRIAKQVPRSTGGVVRGICSPSLWPGGPRRAMGLIAGLVVVVWVAVSGSGAASAAERTEFPPATPESQNIAAESLNGLAAAVDGFVQDGRIVGAELLVIKNRKTVLHRAFGLGDREAGVPMAINTIFNIRSMTKPVTGTVAQMLIDEGKLVPNAPAADYLDSFDNERSRSITIEHLLTHRSGLAWTACMDQGSLREIADCCGERGPEEFIPGTAFRYSNGGSSTIGAIVEKISGLPLDEYMAARLFTTLGMKDTLGLHKGDDPRIARCASRYERCGDGWAPCWKKVDGAQFEFMRGAQGLGTTPMDYARFLAMWMDAGVVGGRRLLSDKAIRRGLTPASLADIATGFTDTRVYYGQQWVLYTDSSNSRVFAWGHSGAEGTFAWVWPERDLMILYFTQAMNTESGFLMERAIDGLLLDRGEYGDPELEKLQPYLGLYWCREASMCRAVFERDGKLTLEVPERGLFTLRATDEADRWEVAERPGYIITFKRGADGGVAALIPPAATHESPYTRMEAKDDPIAAAQLVELHLRGHGTAALKNLGVHSLSGRIDLKTYGWTGTNRYISDGVRRFREDVAVPGIGDETVIMKGHRVWMVSSLTGPEELTGTRREQMLLARPSVLIGDWRDSHREVRVVKRTRMGAEDVYVVRAIPHEAAPVTFIVDAQTGLVRKSMTMVEIPAYGPVAVVTKYGDYRDVEGVMLPFHWEVSHALEALGEVEVRYEEVRTRLEIDDDVFEVKPLLVKD